MANDIEYQSNNMLLKFMANRKPNTPRATHSTQEILENKKWATFTYVGKETRHITKLFKNTNTKTAFKTTNNLKKHLLSNKIAYDKYEKPGVYKLKCMDCHRQYIGQTGRSFKTRYKEHIRDIRNNRETSGYVQHILETGQSYGKMNDIMEVIKIEQKGSYLNTLENFHIFKLFK
jgi:uncharacterized protein involved in tolerance to divalent cations